MSPEDWAHLTHRQINAVACAVLGRSQMDAAQSMGITRSTLKEHLHAAARKLGLESE